MSFSRSGNPTFSEKYFQPSARSLNEGNMTVRGTLNKFGFLFLMVMATSIFTWRAFMGGQDVKGFIVTGVIGGMILALVMIFRQHLAPYLAPAYALMEGLFLGSVSAIMHSAFATKAPYLVIQAVMLTFGTVIAMYILYQFRIIQATARFRTVVMACTLGVCLFYLMTFMLGIFGINIPFIHEGSLIGILFSLLVVVIAALNLILDFDMIEEGAAAGAPKYMEWYGAFGLLVTIVWLYVEILRLLSKINSRN
jgi:uncharacterized YccA/Bax inhibitor family protein